jgi:hypothetical protein
MQTDGTQKYQAFAEAWTQRNEAWAEYWACTCTGPRAAEELDLGRMMEHKALEPM